MPKFVMLQREEVYPVEQFLQVILDFIAWGGYLAIAAGMAMESACLPVPSELIFGFTGYLVYLGRLDFTAAVLAGVAGGLLGSILAYLVGYYGGPSLVAQYGKYVLLSANHVKTAQKWFDRYGLKAAFFSRLLPVVRTFVSLPAGFARVNFIKFSLLTVLGSVPWTIGLIYAGKLLGENWRQISAAGHNAALAVAGGLLVIAAYNFWKNRNQLNAG